MSKRDEKHFQAFDQGDDWDDDSSRDDWDAEPIGSCDSCECNLYRDDEYDGLCSQCAWTLGLYEDDDMSDVE